MAIGASGDGEFISKYSDDIPENDDKSKRSVKDNDEGANERKVLLPVKITKRSARKSRKAHKRDKTATAGIARAPQDIDVSCNFSCSSIYIIISSLIYPIIH